MNKRKLSYTVISFLFGVCLASYDFWVFFGISAAFFIWQFWLCSAGKTAGKKAALYLAILLASFLAGAGRGTWRQQESIEAQEYFSRSSKMEVLGQLYQKEQKGEGYYYYLKDCVLQSSGRKYSCSKILVILDTDAYSIGKTLYVKGKTKAWKEARNEGGYDEKAYYQSLDIEGAIEDGVVEKQFGKENHLAEYLYHIRLKLKDSYETCMGSSYAGVMEAMTLGDKSGMDKDLKTLFQNAGVSHFYSISGIHLSILGMTLFGILRKVNCSYPLSAGVTGGFLCCYGYLTGFGISQTRAIGMFLLLLYGKCRGRSYDSQTALSLLAFFMAWKNPKILNHTGFLLSFGAVCGVLLGAKLKEQFSHDIKPGKESRKSQGNQTEKKKNRKLPGAQIKDTVLISACIQLVTLPVLCNYFYEISLYAILVNLCIIPCMGILLALGLIGGVAGCIFPMAGKVLLLPCAFILWIFQQVCSLILKLPFAVLITGKLSLCRVLLWYGSLFFLFALGKDKKKIKTVLCLFFWAMLLILPVKRQTEWDILDVGQGDGICFMEKDGTVMFLDGGSVSETSVGTYQILPFLKYHGIRKIDYWFLSHLDKDHVSGMMEVAQKGFPINCLVLAEGIVRDEAWEEMTEFGKKYKIPIVYMKENARLQGAGGEWRITCLYPSDKNGETDRNHASLVLYYESGAYRGLFTGDLSKEQEQALIRKHKIPEIDLLKVSHHGSKNGTCEELLRAARPKSAVISCGLYNTYGHPGDETLERLERMGTRVYETRFEGQIKIVGGKVIGGRLHSECVPNL